ncbi:hypothetical protein ABZW18_26220 [Streptomyces sp. NPDC004647]|uniref:hypothetical protein n=1 Tax=Streptomyces sp. NPDC004647 TaxID=3154671 RepID=UPI0033B33AF2
MPVTLAPAPAAAAPIQPFTVTVLVNVAMDNGRFANFDGYQEGRPVAEVSTTAGQVLRMRFTAVDEQAAAEAAFSVGNRQSRDDLGQTWPHDVRSVSVGDVLRVEDDHGRAIHLAVLGVGFDKVDPPRNTVPLQGSPATSRGAAPRS